MSKLINAEVNHTYDIERFVKHYIVNQAQSQEPPFESVSKKRGISERAQKTSLSDWRVLFNKENEQKLFAKHYTSDRKFDKTYRTPIKTRNSVRPFQQIKSKANKTSNSFRQTFIDSALVQNYYEAEYIDERKIQTAKIRRHYLKNHQQRPASINISNRKNYQSRTSKQQNIKQQNLCIQKRESNHKVLQNIWAEKYESIKINRKYIRKHNDIIIEGLKTYQNNKNIEGLRFYAKQN